MLAGCYVEGSAGYYTLPRSTNTSSNQAYSFGLGIGVFIDPGPVRVAAGLGGDLLFAEQNLEDSPEATQEHKALGLQLGIDPRLAYIDRRGDQLVLSMRYAIRWGKPIEIDYGRTELIERGISQSFFLGPGLYFRYGRGVLGGLMISLGAAAIYTVTDSPYDILAVGGQIRIVGGNYPDLSNIAGFAKVMLTPTDRDGQRSEQLQDQYWRGQGFQPCSEFAIPPPECN